MDIIEWNGVKILSKSPIENSIRIFRKGFIAIWKYRDERYRWKSYPLQLSPPSWEGFYFQDVKS